MDHIEAEYNEHERRRLYETYTAELLKVLAEAWGGKVKYHYYELIEPKKNEELSGDEIALEVIRRAGLKGKTNDASRTSD